jgi:hypothetical protein
MATVAGLVLSGTEVGLQLFQGCIKAYKLFTEAKNIGSDSQTLIWKFRIQEHRLEIWGREWGFLGPVDSRDVPASDRQQDDQVMGLLRRISTLLMNYRNLHERYGLSVDSRVANPRVLVRILCHKLKLI